MVTLEHGNSDHGEPRAAPHGPPPREEEGDGRTPTMATPTLVNLEPPCMDLHLDLAGEHGVTVELVGDAGGQCADMEKLHRRGCRRAHRGNRSPTSGRGGVARR